MQNDKLFDDIKDAIREHKRWVLRLQKASACSGANGTSDDIRRCDRCAMGNWIHRVAEHPTMSQSPHFRTVAEAHDDFREAAARVSGLLVDGRHAEARECLDGSSDLNRHSDALVASATTFWLAQR